jgi:hypothetical protein
MPAHDTLAHALLVSGNQGGAAVVGSSSLTSQYVHDLLSKPMMPYLMQPGMTIGDAILTARQQASIAKPYMIDALNAYQILGDPTLVVQP